MDGSGPIRFQGRVSARTCPACGHHEVGITDDDGRFVPLKPGMRIHVLEDLPQSAAPMERFGATAGAAMEPVPVRDALMVWVPDPVKDFPRLRLKYGVPVADSPTSVKMTAEAYEAAYMEKLRGLIAGEADIPLAVLLDRYFTAPQLASGNPLQIAHAMWRELEEIREPVERVKKWLSDPRDAAARALVGTPPPPKSSSTSPDPSALARELEGLTLEGFLSIL